MNLCERIGTMVFTDSGRYIIGASESENAEFQKKSSNIIEFNQRDTVELSYVRTMDMSSENYENYTKITKMPNNCFSDTFGLEMRETIRAAVQAYCNGEMTDEEIKKTFMDVCKDMRVYQAQSRHTSGTNAKDNQQIIEDVYEIFQKANVEFMVDKCFKAGSDLADANGGKEKNNWVYYDTKYYEESQYLRELLQNAASGMATVWSTDFIDFEEIEKGSKFTLNGGLDFHSVWNWRAESRGICSISEEWKSQEDFSFFYQANKNKVSSGEVTLDGQAGVYIVGYGNRQWSIEVPFNGSVILGALADHFNAKDLFVKSNQNGNSDLLNLLQKFDVYTRFYGHNKTMRGE